MRLEKLLLATGWEPAKIAWILNQPLEEEMEPELARELFAQACTRKYIAIRGSADRNTEAKYWHDQYDPELRNAGEILAHLGWALETNKKRNT